MEDDNKLVSATFGATQLAYMQEVMGTVIRHREHMANQILIPKEDYAYFLRLAKADRARQAKKKKRK
jgi:hypothetical protein